MRRLVMTDRKRSEYLDIIEKNNRNPVCLFFFLNKEIALDILLLVMMTLLMCAMFCQVKEIRSRCNIGSSACVNFLFCPISSDWACVSVRVNVTSVSITLFLIFFRFSYSLCTLSIGRDCFTGRPFSRKTPFLKFIH
jgi:hypothetical protein